MCGVVYHIECEQRTGNNIGEIARSPSTRITNTSPVILMPFSSTAEQRERQKKIALD